MAATKLWYPHYIRDFKAKTGHLSLAERGAYRALMDEYWERQGPLPADERALCRLVGAFPDEWAEVRDNVLAFFTLTEGGYRHEGVEHEIWRFRNPRRTEKKEWAELRKMVFERDDYTCTYCGKRGGALECDHIEPFCSGGSDHPSNLTTACKRCNQIKASKPLEVFLRELEN